MVTVQFRGHLVRQYGARCDNMGLDSLGPDIRCLIILSLYYVYKASQSCLP